MSFTEKMEGKEEAMRVLHINCNYIGTKLHRVMVKHLADAGVENHVFVPVQAGLGELPQLGENVHIAPCFKKWDRLWFAGKQRKIISAARSVLQGIPRPDCIHAYTLFTDGNCALELFRETGIPYVVAVRKTDVYVFFKYMIHLRARGVEILKNASAVFFLSPLYEDLVLERFVPRDEREAILRKSSVIPNGIDDFWFDNLHVRETADAALEKGRTITVLQAGEINVNKNQLLTAEGISRLNSRGWDIRLRVVGRVRNDMVRRRLERREFISLLPMQPFEELIREYRGADIFVMPSIIETFGMVYAEALSQGLPVIYTRGQGFDGQFPEGTVGYSTNSRDPEELAACIEKVCARYGDLSRNCTEKVQRFRWDTIIQEYLRIYAGMAAGRSGDSGI